MRTIRVATRGSDLALTQTRAVMARLRNLAPHVSFVELPLRTQGDKESRPLREVGGKGLFVAELREALLDGRAELAVHSMKDLPGDVPMPEGLRLLAVPEREDPADVWIHREGRDIERCDSGTRVGTCSLRRAMQLRRHRGDLQILPLRGNVPTRMNQVEASLQNPKLDAVVVAAAGLSRLGICDNRSQTIPTEIMLPAVGQGALAIEGHDTEELRSLLAPLREKKAWLEVAAERALLERLQGNCHVPLAGLARLTPQSGRLALEALVGSSDGDQLLSGGGERYLPLDKEQQASECARELGQEVADNLLRQGARRLIQQALVGAQLESGSNGKNGGSPHSWRWRRP